MFKKILIANRGEIACRVAATARRMGIQTVAVYSDADAQAAHVAACDESVYIGGSEPRDSYLRADVILQAARQTGAQAIHPGYGFLSENENFAQACAKAGIVFIGPPASAIAAMGSKSAAKALMETAGVPLVPGYHGDNQDMEFLHLQADQIGYPVLIKASAGGGGKGMRIVKSSQEFPEALSSCKREAISSFGDDKVLVERYLTKPRHIEIQVFADSHGNTLHLFERDCSVQRRHQKVIEEAPAPGMTEERRREMGEAAVAAAKAVGYVGAGTVEFIAEPDGRFYFMEMNTRLQVEHPVTEMITGTDLVEWQLRVAAGEPLPAEQDDLFIEGHAIEARIYAENPEKGFLPSIGTLSNLTLPEHVKFELGEVRVDGGVRQGDTISPFYDPMIAKLIVWADSREQAIARMQQALAQTRVVGVNTNVAFLGRLMQNSAFASADLDTGLIEKHSEQLLPAPKQASIFTLASLTAAIMARQGQTGSTTNRYANKADPWSATDGWRLSGHYTQHIRVIDNDEARLVTLEKTASGWQLLDNDIGYDFEWQVQITPDQTCHCRLSLNGSNHQATVVMQGEQAHVFENGTVTIIGKPDELQHAADDSDAHGGGLTAPMPGKIISLLVQAGDTVTKGQALLVMEAMKMEHTITAPEDGKVEEVFYAVGDQVTEGVELITVG
ncbi:acetyl/propionyl/methylcrotonyl-CoA carboxylase subunit alpha [Advenella sp. EE-W14]|uniref:acetyl/propionyl/methylcrotonyl-CoA carboxylase subunit alpha n=1 Tax=Advenella sp. EE-W14 TaxID=2722705 RepID=UPI00145DA112|nr:acetyl/propionyl/methylcrotonyl-CoA carboxylase subunit alpha [Advenella sp. EE-W14]